MYVNERDQINYHGFLRALREMNQVSQGSVGKGICTVSGMNRFENGNRVAEKLMRDRLTARLGISGEKYEDYLQPKEYVRWEQRLRIVKAIEKRDLSTAKSELDSYENLKGHNRVNVQFVGAMRFMILMLEHATDEVLLECIKKAIKCTVPNVSKALAGEHLLADQEINLIAEQMRLCPPKKVVRDERTWRVSEYEKLIAYIEDSHWEKLQKAKVYPKVAYYICQLLLEKETTEAELRRGLELCYNAIELLRDTSRLYYFIELTEARRALATRLMKYGADSVEETKLQEMLTENNQWENVFKELYAEYKVAPYMSDFCYLYYETECHNMVEVIETRRKMLGLSRVRLGEGICTEKTIVRFEREGRNPSIDLARLLFEKMGMCAEYRRARVITNDVEALMLSDEIGQNVNCYNLDDWEINMQKLEQRLNMNICLNRQQIIGLKNLLGIIKKEISAKEYHDRNIEALECSVPLEALGVDKKKYYTREEINLIFNQAYEAIGDVSNQCVRIIEDMCEAVCNIEIEPAKLCVYELLMDGFESYLGNKGEFNRSIKVANHMLKECLANRRMETIPNNLYNNIWNYQEQHKLINSQVDIEWIDKKLTECIIISDLIHKSNWTSFFQQKYKELINI